MVLLQQQAVVVAAIGASRYHAEDGWIASGSDALEGLSR